VKLAELKTIVDRTLGLSRGAGDLDVTVRIYRPGSVGAAPCVAVKQAGQGIDWESGRFELFVDEFLTTITDEQREDLSRLASKGVTWASYEHHKKTQARIAELQAQYKAAERTLESLGYTYSVGSSMGGVWEPPKEDTEVLADFGRSVRYVDPCPNQSLEQWLDYVWREASKS
jgi:hypothetical protein